MKSSSAYQTSELSVFVDCLELHHFNPDRYPFFLNSAAQNLAASETNQNRYDILFAFPGKSIELNSSSLNEANRADAADFFSVLSDWFEKEKTSYNADLPFSGGWFVYLSYEVADLVEKTLSLPADTSGLPKAVATRFQHAIVYDYLTSKAFFVSETGTDHNEKLLQLQSDLKSSSAIAAQHFEVSVNEEEPETHINSLNKIHQYIIDGDIFQANLSRLWQVEFNEEVSDALVYKRLCENNPAPFACLCKFTNGTIISSSPERLVSLKNGRVDTRPIAGTRPRSDDKEKDQALLSELISHPKERAEHIMLLDLERNDLGRVCKPGSIHVDELMTIESYQHVHHIVSNVTGQIDDGVNPVELIKAVFPGGTITGCPKVRCMEILAELEKTGRGAYTGSVGYINRNGDLDFNILIRTLVKSGTKASFRAGGGIVADSIAVNELEETRFKAKGLLKALVND